MTKKSEKILGYLMAAAILAMPLLTDTSRDAAEGAGLISSGGLVNQHPGIMRFHVVANSDSDEDQELKLLVRNYVLAKVENEITQSIVEAGGPEADQSAVMREYIEGNLPRIESWAREVVELHNFDYEVKAYMGIRHIPAKQYGDLFFPEGNYEALTLSIGEGAGQNWWCVVFPPLCLVDSEDSAYCEELGVSDEDRLSLRFKTAELLEALPDNESVSAAAIYQAFTALNSSQANSQPGSQPAA